MANPFFPSELTKVTAKEFAAAVGFAWKKVVGRPLSDGGVYMVTGHWGLETGWGLQMHNYNCGNVKATDKWSGGVTYYQAGENFDKAMYADYFPRTYPGQGVVNRFRAFATLQDGVDDFVAFIQGYASVLEGGDPAAYAHALKQNHYYTASEEEYTKTLSGCYGHARQLIGAVPPPALTEVRRVEPAGNDPCQDPDSPLKPRKYDEKVYWPYPARGDHQDHRSPYGPCCGWCNGLFAMHNGFRKGQPEQSPLLQGFGQAQAQGSPGGGPPGDPGGNGDPAPGPGKKDPAGGEPAPVAGSPLDTYGARAARIAFERALNARGFALDGGEAWKLDDPSQAQGLFHAQKPLPGDAVTVVTATGPRCGRVATVACSDAEDCDAGALWLVSASGPLHQITVEQVVLEAVPVGFDAGVQEGGKPLEVWRVGEQRPTEGHAWIVGLTRYGQLDPDKVARMEEGDRSKFKIKKGEVQATPGTVLSRAAKQHAGDPTVRGVVYDDGGGSDSKGDAGGGPAAADPKAPPIVELPAPVAVDNHTVRLTVGNYGGRVAFSVQKPGEALPTCPPAGPSPDPTANGKRDAFIQAAINFLGAPYLAGSSDPEKGVDGVGLVALCLRRVGVLKKDDPLPDAGSLHAMFTFHGGTADTVPDDILPGDIAWYGKGTHDVDAQQHPMIHLGGGRVLGPLADGGAQGGAVQILAAKDVPESFAGWSHIDDLGIDTGHTEHPGPAPSSGAVITGALLPAGPAGRYDALMQLAKARGGSWFEEKGKVNLVGVKNLHHRSLIVPEEDGWNDTLFACFLDDDGHKCALELRASINPGTDKDKAGTWQLLDGAWKFKLVDGDQTGGKALQPDGSVRGWFDQHGLGALRPGDLKHDQEQAGGDPAPQGKGSSSGPGGQVGGGKTLGPGDQPKPDDPKPEPKKDAPKDKVTSGNIRVGGKHFADWFNEEFRAKYPGNHETLKLWGQPAPKFPAKVNKANFQKVFDNVDKLWAPELTIPEFLAFFGIFYNETGGSMEPVGEMGKQKYMFEPTKGGKASYNSGASGSRKAGDQLAAAGVISDQADIDRWNGTVYPDDAPDNVKEAAKQCDFWKYRGHGFIQTTWRGNYQKTVDPHLVAAGHKTCDELTTEEMEEIIRTDPRVNLPMVKSFFQHIGGFKKVNEDPPVWYDTGRAVSGQKPYGDLYQWRLETLWAAMKDAGVECQGGAGGES